MNTHFDIIVIGAGHAGVEAALAGQRTGSQVLLISNNLSRISYMSCNPSIGGLGKGHIVKEMDLLGGAMGQIADKTCIQFKKLNASKGPAVRGSRMQCDKNLYSQKMKDYVEAHTKKQHPLMTLEAEVKQLRIKNNTVIGICLQDGSFISAQSVVITTGTFMRGVMHIGLQKTAGGRVGEKASYGLSEQMASLGFKVRRLKTGTPPRLDKLSIDWSKTTPQNGDPQFVPFSFKSAKKLKLPQILCYSTYTNEHTHDLIRKALKRSPLHVGTIVGTGPRYCPSIEDKIIRFSDKKRHLSFLEPEGLNTNSIYLQGLSTSLPTEDQYQFLHTIPGLEKVKILRSGYAVEYDFFDPLQIKPSLETKFISNLYFAGQVNGTSGYEEAGGQGLVAGTNASLSLQNKKPLILKRHESYIGVLIDDLVTKGTEEPYRMLTARAEHRLVLREDNVAERLLDISYKKGLITDVDFDLLNQEREKRQELHRLLSQKKISPTQEVLKKLKALNFPTIQKQTSLKNLLRRFEVDFKHLEEFGLDPSYHEDISYPVTVDIKYEGYIEKQKELIDQAKRLEQKKIPQAIIYKKVKGLSNEAIEKLSAVRPETIAQASRISGVNPSAIQSVLIHIKGHFN